MQPNDTKGGGIQESFIVSLLHKRLFMYEIGFLYGQRVGVSSVLTVFCAVGRAQEERSRRRGWGKRGASIASPAVVFSKSRMMLGRGSRRGLVRVLGFGVQSDGC